ncbi:FAD-binding domain-containing protein [Abortiporus biennis]|nr:FAD-binding domain-containing protein [Abortiporus biennis]
MFSSIWIRLLFLLFIVDATLADQAHLHQDLYPRPVTEEDWAVLNVSVDGRLIRGLPFSQPCFTDPNSSACKEVQQYYRDGNLRYNVPGSTTQTNWETCQITGQRCLLNEDDPRDPDAIKDRNACEMGSISSYYIDVRNSEDVVQAFKFSRKTKISLVIKNTGHDYIGRSTAPDSLGLWMHNMKSMTYIPEFVPVGCSENDDFTVVTAIRMQAGVQWDEAYAFADQHNVTVVGGSDPKVGAVGGWLQGGGHGMLSNTLGLGVDRVLQFTVVTPNGTVHVANKYQAQDLFFALRGGGGGTFGVVLDATILASPPLTLQMTVIQWEGFHLDILSRFIKVLMNNAENMAHNGYGIVVSPNTGVFVTPTLSADQAEVIMAPIINFRHSLSIPNVTVHSQTFHGWLPFYSKIMQKDRVAIGINMVTSSRFIPRSSFSTTKAREQLHSALVQMTETTEYIMILGTSPFTFHHDGTTSVTDAWRDTIWHVVTGRTWSYNATLAEKRTAYGLVSTAADHLRSITPPGAYQNEADVHEPGHEVTFWGIHHDRLLSIKEKYDPDRLLDCWHCGWQKDSPRFRCYL